MNILGLIGNPIKNSRSPEIFKSFFQFEKHSKWEYRLFELSDIAEVAEVFSISGIRGLNVTIPFKETVIPLLTSIHPEAATVGAVNTIKIVKENSSILTYGYNTDVYGFNKSLISVFGSNYRKALILGFGGAGKAVAAALEQLQVPYSVVRQKGEFTYKDVTHSVLKEHDLIVNATPLGMNQELPELPYSAITPEHCFFDLIYHHEKTPFLNEASKKGARVANGLNMLRFQAEKSWEIFRQDSKSF